MRKILPYLLLLTVVFTFAQNPLLTSNKWYLVGGTNVDMNLAKDNINFPYVDLKFFNTNSGLIGSSNYSAKTDCSSGFSGHLTYTGTENGSSSFTFTDFNPYIVDSGCLTFDDTMLNLMEVYKNFFSNYINDTFTYIIQDVYGVDNIRMENSNGDVLWFTENPFSWVPDNLTTHNWNLQKIVIDNVDILAPDFSIEQLPNIQLAIKNYFYESMQGNSLSTMFSTDACYSVNAMINVDLNQFYLYEFGGTTSDCGNSTLRDFSNQYMDFYLDNLPGPFTFEFTTENGEEVLTIYNQIENKAVYRNSTALNNDFNLTNFNIYPNPSSDKIIIKSNNSIKKIKVFNYLGQKVSEYKSNDIDVFNFANGIYFIEVKFKNNKKAVKKFVKY